LFIDIDGDIGKGETHFIIKILSSCDHLLSIVVDRNLILIGLITTSGVNLWAKRYKNNRNWSK